MTQHSTSHGITLSRSEGLSGAVAIGAGVTLVVGLFVLLDASAAFNYTSTLPAFALNGLLALISIVSYAELSRNNPHVRGSYVWVQQAFGPIAGFMTGWIAWLAFAGICALLTLGFGRLASTLIQTLGWQVPANIEWPRLLALAALMLFTIVNYLGLPRMRRLASLMIFAVLALLVVLIFIQFRRIDLTQITLGQFLPHNFSGVIATMGLGFAAFAGHEFIVLTNEELHSPQRTFARALVLSNLLASAFAIVAIFIVQVSGVTEQPLLSTFADVVWPGAKLIVLLGGTLIVLRMVSTGLRSMTRVAFTLGRERFLPDVFGAIHPRFHTPSGSLLFSVLPIAALIILFPLPIVAAITSLMFLIEFILVQASAIALHGHTERSPSPRAALMPLLPLIGIGLMLGLALYLISVDAQITVVAVIWIGVGTSIFYLYASRRPEEERTPILATPLNLSCDFRVLLPVARPDRVDALARVAAMLAAAYKGEVVAMHVEIVPGQLPLNTGRSFVDKNRSLIDRAQEICAALQVSMHPLLSVARDVVSGIVESVRETKADVIIMGWRPSPSSRDRLLGTTLDPLLVSPPCDLLILRDGTFDSPQRIMVPLAGGANATLAAKYALALAEQSDGQVCAITIVPKRALESEQHAAEKMLHELLGKLAKHPRMCIKIVRARDPESGILSEAKEHDLVMIGASDESTLDLALFGNVPERVARNSTVPVMIVKRRRGFVTGWLQRILSTLSELLPRLSQEERVDVYRSIRRAARPDADYFVMIGLSSGIASLGLLLNSPAVIIGAMLVAPLMAAIIGLGMGVVMGDLRTLKISASATARGALLAVGVGMLAGWLAVSTVPTNEVLSRTQPTLFDLAVALVSGAAGAYALCREDVSASLPGVAIAVALVPPLATVGIGLAFGSLAISGGALLLFTTNLIGISAAGVIVFLIFGFRPSPDAARISILRRGALGAGLLLVAVALTLGTLTFKLIDEVQFNTRVNAAIDAQVAQLEDAELIDSKVERDETGALRIELTISTPNRVSFEQTRDLQKGIAENTQQTVELLLTVIPVTRLDPFVPPTPTPTITPSPTATIMILDTATPIATDS